MIPTPIPELTDAAILEAIERLKSPAYAKLSKIHTEYLEALEAQARIRNLKTP
jgi:hypothetical protein